MENEEGGEGGGGGGVANKQKILSFVISADEIRTSWSVTHITIYSLRIFVINTSIDKLCGEFPWLDIFNRLCTRTHITEAISFYFVVRQTANVKVIGSKATSFSVAYANVLTYNV